MAAGLLWVALGAAPWAAEPPQPQETANYAVGYELGRGLLGLQRLGIGVAPEAIFRGALDALSGTEPRVDRPAMDEALRQLGAEVAEPGAAASPAAEPPARRGAYRDDFAALNAKRPGVVTLPSGVQYEVLTPGQGRTPGIGDQVRVRYEGRLTTGVVFDTTLDDAEPLRVRVADIVVPGLREALLAMKEGDKWHVVIPPRLGFGAVGNNMLRKRDLIYDIELVAVEPATEGPTPGPSGTATGRPE